MNPEDMRPDIRYIVTKGSSDNKFREGDFVYHDYNKCYCRTDTAGGVLSYYHPKYDDKIAYDFEAEVWTDPELEKKITGSIQEGEVSLDDTIVIYRQSSMILSKKSSNPNRKSKELWMIAEWLESYRDLLNSASVSFDGMKPGIDYVVTRCSSNGDIVEGDILRLKDDGALLARNQRSKFLWIEKEELKKNCACSDFQVREYSGSDVCYDPAGKPDTEDCVEACLQESDYRMSLEEAITHAEETSERLARKHILEGQECLRCAIEHKQLADWLRELLKLRMATEYMNNPISDSPYAETIAENRESVSKLEECIGRVYEVMMRRALGKG